MDPDERFSADELACMNGLACSLLSARTFSQLADAVLDALPSIVPHGRGFLTREPNAGGSRRRILYTHTMGAEELDLYERVFASYDYSAWFLEQGDVVAYRDTDIVSIDVMEQSRIFNEWVRPMGMYYACGAVFRERGVRAGDITLFRAEEDGDFTDRELFMLSLVVALVDRWLGAERPAPKQAAPSSDPGLSALTERELEVARLACTGMSVRQMSDYLAISYGTARRHLANIYEKLGIGSRVQLIEIIGQ